MSINWSDYKNFSATEFDCSQTGENSMRPEFMDLLQSLRDAVGPLTVNSGYRSPLHTIEAAKEAPGSHSYGLAADLMIKNPSHAHLVTREALRLFPGIGLSRSFLHVDCATHVGRPAIWTY